MTRNSSQGLSQQEQVRPPPLRFEALLSPQQAGKLQQAWLRQEALVLPGATAGRGTLPGSGDLQAWMRSNRLRSASVQLWRTGTDPIPECLPVDPRAWTHAVRLGHEVAEGVLHGDAVRRHMAHGGWLWVCDLQRVDAGSAMLLARWQDTLGMPVRLHAWQRQQACETMAGSDCHQVGLAMPVPDSQQHRFLHVVEGVWNVQWKPLGGAEAGDGVHLHAQAGDLLYLPPAAQLSWSGPGNGWALELLALPATVADAVAMHMEGVLQQLRGDATMRRCPAGRHEEKASESLVADLARATVPPPAVAVARRHMARWDEAKADEACALQSISHVLMDGEDAQLQGCPQRVAAERQSKGRRTLVLAKKEIHFNASSLALLDFLLQSTPYRLKDGPAGFSMEERKNLACALIAEGLVNAKTAQR
jgi:hypothetical protein